MDLISKRKILKFVRYVNDKKLVPKLLYNTRISKQQLIQQIKKYWQVTIKDEIIYLQPLIRVPPFQFRLQAQDWDFELVDFQLVFPEFPLRYYRRPH